MIKYTTNQIHPPYLLKGVGVKQISKLIKQGNVIVLPTDTIYGICASALNQEAVEKVYQLRNRDRNKPCIIIIGDICDLKKFNIKTDKKLLELLNNIWPNKISIALPCPAKKFEYLHKGTKSLAFRIPKNNFLLKLLEITGPIIAPSANIAEKLPAKNIQEAYKYFGSNVFYIIGEKIKEKASTLIKIEPNFDIKVLRKNADSGNKYFLIRHGEAISNIKNVISSLYPEKWDNPLTEKGAGQVAKNVKKLENKKIDLIVSSPFLRAKQTAQIIKNKLQDFNKKQIPLIYDARLKEINCGTCEGKNVSCYDNLVKSHIKRYEKMFKNGESLRDIKIRMLEVVFELEKKYKNSNVLIISHGHPLWTLLGAMQGYSEKETSKHLKWNFKLGEVKEAIIFNYNK